MEINDLSNQISELGKSLGNRLTDLEQSFRRHKHLGQAYDQTEQLGASGSTPSPAGDGWSLMSSGVINAGGGSELILDGLHGDVDKNYRLIVSAQFNTPENTYLLRINTLTPIPVYTFGIQKHGFTGGDINANVNPGPSPQSEIPLFDGSWSYGYLDLMISAIKGRPRLMLGKHTLYRNSQNYAQMDIGAFWLNASDEIQSINLRAGQNFSMDSEYWLFKLP